MLHCSSYNIHTWKFAHLTHKKNRPKQILRCAQIDRAPGTRSDYLQTRNRTTRSIITFFTINSTSLYLWKYHAANTPENLLTLPLKHTKVQQNSGSLETYRFDVIKFDGLQSILRFFFFCIFILLEFIRNNCSSCFVFGCFLWTVFLVKNSP